MQILIALIIIFLLVYMIALRNHMPVDYREINHLDELIKSGLLIQCELLKEAYSDDSDTVEICIDGKECYKIGNEISEKTYNYIIRNYDKRTMRRAVILRNKSAILKYTRHILMSGKIDGDIHFCKYTADYNNSIKYIFGYRYTLSDALRYKATLKNLKQGNDIKIKKFGDIYQIYTFNSTFYHNTPLCIKRKLTCEGCIK